LATIKAHRSKIFSLCFHDVDQLATSGGDGYLKLWDLNRSYNYMEYFNE